MTMTVMTKRPIERVRDRETVDPKIGILPYSRLEESPTQSWQQPNPQAVAARQSG